MRGIPKRMFAFRFDPVLMAEAKRRVGDGRLTVLMEDLLLAWLKRERRKDERAAATPNADPLAKHLAPPTDREIAARTGTPPLHDAKDSA